MCGISLIPDKAERMGRFSNPEVVRFHWLSGSDNETGSGVATINIQISHYYFCAISVKELSVEEDSASVTASLSPFFHASTKSLPFLVSVTQ